ncbi:MAG: protein translocase subunit SecD [Spirochaetaceae bacterium]|nr:MAG: protein translocase subunit SecD [Spirochaetaceae bacterium]
MSKRVRLLTVLVLIIIGGFFVWPTVNWYFLLSPQEQELARLSRTQVREYAQDQARTTLLELRELSTESPQSELPEEYRFLIDTARENYRLEERDLPSTWVVRDVLAGFRSEREAFEAIESHHRDRIQQLQSIRDRIIQLGLDLSGGVNVVLEADRASLAERLGEDPTQEQMDEAVSLALEILSNRIDRFGITEPQIRRMDQARISIEIPGDDDRERVDSFLMGRGSLNFHIVDDEATAELAQLQQQQPGWSPEVDGVPDFVPAGSRIAEYVTRDQYGIDQFVRYIVIREDVSEHGLPGQHITEAQVGRDPLTNRPLVNFVLDGEGTRRFSVLTRDNVGSSMAIVMDDRVRAYATIQEEIPTGQVRISGFDQDQAQNIARVLRTAALPIDLNVLNQQTVGAQLGAETIQAGLRAIALGFALVMIFMVIYYKGAGIIADLVLTLNLFFIVSILSVFNLTLTLTSIAGVILTVGMAVDANVIIFERIKEEYRLGKSPQAAVRAGFDKAFWTVMDANITTFIAAVFLSQLGSGPIQGFAVTLSVGIVSSMFTALFVSRLVFDFSTEVLRRSKLSIAWGL